MTNDGAEFRETYREDVYQVRFAAGRRGGGSTAGEQAGGGDNAEQ